MSHAYVCIQISKVCNFVVFTVNMLQNFYPQNFGGKDTKIHTYEWLCILDIRARDDFTNCSYSDSLESDHRFVVANHTF